VAIFAAIPLAQESVFLSELQQQFSSTPSNSSEEGSFQTSRSLFFLFTQSPPSSSALLFSSATPPSNKNSEKHSNLRRRTFNCDNLLLCALVSVPAPRPMMERHRQHLGVAELSGNRVTGSYPAIPWLRSGGRRFPSCMERNLVWFLGCGGALLGIGDDRREARVTVKQFEVRILLHGESVTGSEPMVDGLA